MRYFFVSTLIAVFTYPGVSAFSQASDTLFESNGFKFPNGIYIEFLGPAGFYSAGYERVLLNQDQFKTSLQAAVAWYPASLGFMRLSFPLGINEILSFDQHHVKIGIGTVMVLKRFSDAGENTQFLANLRIGYRYQRTRGKFFWEVSLTPFLEGDTSAFELNALGNMTAHMWAGLTVGRAF